MKRYLRIIVLMTLLHPSFMQANCYWPAWSQFKEHYINKQGRVIDFNNGQNITTSEGQSYALFFALVANDQTTFDNLLQWTTNNLAKGDLSKNLPAWLWGHSRSGSWQVLDANSASDSDLWIAYSLLEAGRLWKKADYTTLGEQLLQQVIAKETVDIPGLGHMLLPGQHGFVSDDGWRLNPSYQPPQLLSRFSQINPIWQQIRQTNYRLLTESSPQGFAPDWSKWTTDKNWSYPPPEADIGSYNAIRVYLWIGMLSDDDIQKRPLIAHFSPMVRFIEQYQYPPETVHVLTGKTKNQGPFGFSAALLPLLQTSPTLDIQRIRVLTTILTDNNYYNAVLTLFGQGWDQQRYRFNHQGELIPLWSKNSCTTSH